MIWAVTLAPLQAGLIAFYPFEGNANDATGHGNNGTVVNAVVTASGYEGQAYSFNGSNSYIGIPVNINPGAMPQLTMGAWARAEVANPVQAVISHDNGGFDRNLNMDYRNCAGSACWSAFTGSGVVPGPVVTTGQWVFLAVRYDAGAGSVVLDVDTTRVSTSGSPGSGWNTVRIGSNPSFVEFFSGRIDNVFIYHRILSDAEIEAIRLGGADAILPHGVPEPGTIGLLALGIGMLLAFKLRR